MNKIVIKILNKIDQFCWRRGGKLYSFWFVFEPDGGDFDEEHGYVLRRFFRKLK